MKLFYSIGVSMILLLILTASCEFISTSCEDIWLYNEYPFYNDTNDTIFIYEHRYHDTSDTLKVTDALKRFRGIQRIYPGENVKLCIIGVEIEKYKSGNSQIMVFKQQTLTDYTLKEISDKNIYDHLYIYTWKQILEPGFEIRYTSHSSNTE